MYDIITLTNSLEKINCIKQEIQEEFEIKALGEP